MCRRRYRSEHLFVQGIGLQYHSGFQNDFAGTKIIKLEQNYRSTQTILEAAANKIIECNHQRMPKTLYATPELGEGEKIRYYQSYDAEGEAAFVADRIVESSTPIA